MKKKNRAFALLLGVCLGAGLLPGSQIRAAENTNVPEAGKGDIVIIHTNDSHSRVDTNMGMAGVAALKEYYEATGAQVLLADAGDTLHGLPFATVEEGSSVVDVMNLAGYDVMTPGNHDFNYGSEHLLELREEMEFELLAANVKNAEDGTDFVSPYTILERDGVTLGFFGLVTEETTFKTNPENIETLQFTDPVAAAEEMVSYLQDRGVDYIIAVTHLGTDASSEVTSELVAKNVDGIDLIIDGHSHTAYEKGCPVGDTLIVSTGEYMNAVGVVVISDDELSGTLVTAEDFPQKDEETLALIADINMRQEEILSEVVGTTAVTLDGERQTNRTGETNLGNLTADAMRYATGADVAITNGGGIRATIVAGDITRRDLVTVFPFGNYVVTKELTGAELLQALENGVKAYPESLGGFPQVSGISFTFDAAKPAGERVTGAMVNGSTLDREAVYLVATNNFLAAGGDEYTVFADKPVLNEYASLEEVVLTYLQEVGEIPQTEGRITAETTEAAEKETEVPEPEKEDTDKNKEEASDWYTVVRGDYLRKIAVKFYGAESLWKKIYEANKDKIQNPDLIYAGMRLLIP